MHASRRRERKRALGRQIGASYKAGNQSRWGEDEGPRTACELHFPMHLVRPLHRESAHDGLNIEGPGARSHVWRGVRVATRVRASLVGGFPLDAWKNAENYTRYAVLRRETIVKSIDLNSRVLHLPWMSQSFRCADSTRNPIRGYRWSF